MVQLMANTIPFKEEIFNSSLEELMKTVSESPYTMQAVPPRYVRYFRMFCLFELNVR
jgi:hypothetical protein